jgi:hypothetical protein
MRLIEQFDASLQVAPVSMPFYYGALLRPVNALGSFQK